MKTQKINLHTHCTFCDGKNTAEEMVLSAINKGFTVLGFSSHCIYPLTSDFYKTPDDEWHIPADKIQDYLKEISRLKEKYSNEIMDAMKAKFGYKNVMQIPKLDKIVIRFRFIQALKPTILKPQRLAQPFQILKFTRP